MFDDKTTSQAEFCFNCAKGGVAWKIKLWRYFIARAAILRDVLEFVELEDIEDITFERFLHAMGGALTSEQVMNINASMWGFLASCVVGQRRGNLPARRAPQRAGRVAAPVPPQSSRSRNQLGNHAP